LNLGSGEPGSFGESGPGVRSEGRSIGLWQSKSLVVLLVDWADPQRRFVLRGQESQGVESQDVPSSGLTEAITSRRIRSVVHTLNPERAVLNGVPSTQVRYLYPFHGPFLEVGGATESRCVSLVVSED